MSEPDDPWWNDFHIEALADLYLVRTEAELESTLAFLTRHLELQPGMRVFDQCCGIGSLAVPLGLQGMDVIGVDIVPHYIERANTVSAEWNPCTFVCGDGFIFVPSEPCDAAFNWYSSFGYAGTDTQNQKMLQRLFDALKPGGKIAMDVQNAPGIYHNYKPQLFKEARINNRNLKVVRTSSLDLDRGRLEQQWVWELPGNRRETRHSSVRLYTPPELEVLLKTAGFTDILFFGSETDGPLTLTSPHCLVTARKP